MNAQVLAISVSPNKGEKKKNVEQAQLRADFGIVGDGHAGPGPRQVSLLAVESFEGVRRQGLDVQPGDFAENLTTAGLDLTAVRISDRLHIGAEVVLEVTGIGKTCHDRCRIFEQLGDCVMPREGVFTRVVHGGWIKPGDRIERELPSAAGKDSTDKGAR